MPTEISETRRSAHEDAQLVEVLHRIEPLKHLARTGWVDRGIGEPETVAAHSWRLAMLAWFVADARGLDAARAIQLALAHDLPEAITGDQTPFGQHLPGAERAALGARPPDMSLWRDPARRRLKVEAERTALTEILAGAPAALAGSLRAAWEEYEEGATAEAQLVRQLDKFEAYMQGLEYARDGRLRNAETLASFRADVEQLIHDPLLRALLGTLEGWSANREEHPETHP